MRVTNLTEGNIAKGYIRFALPLFLESLFQQLYSTVDMLFVGQNYGAGKYDRIRRGIYVCNGISALGNRYRP